jgi:aconitate hydratase
LKGEGGSTAGATPRLGHRINGEYVLKDGAVVIAAITSCTNTSNPAVMLGAGLLAQQGRRQGPDREAVGQTLARPGLAGGHRLPEASRRDARTRGARFYVVGYGCTTCIGNSGPLPPEVSKGIADGDLVVASVLSGNRNFEGRVHSEVKMNYLASPPLVVAYALAGTVDIDLEGRARCRQNGNPVYLRDIWPSNKEISDTILATIGPDMFNKNYADVFKGDSRWNQVQSRKASLSLGRRLDLHQAPALLRRHDHGGRQDPRHHRRTCSACSATRSPPTTSRPPETSRPRVPPAFLQARGVTKVDFNSYGARRGNDEVMVRGTFANIRIKNLMLGGEEGGNTIHLPTGEKLSIYDAAMRYKQEHTAGRHRRQGIRHRLLA